MLDDQFVAGLRAVTQPLKGLFEDADRGFLAVGDRLGAAVDTFGRLAGIFDSLPHALNTPQLADAAARLGEIAREVAAMADTLADERAVLSRLVDLNKTAAACISRFQRTVGAIKSLAVNAQITAAGMRGDGEDFSVFTKEIMRLAKRADEAVADCSRACETLASLLGTASATQATFEASHREALVSVAQQLEASLCAVDRHRKQAADATMAIGRRSKEIGGAISVVVMALQVGDITRQRVEHICAALDALRCGSAPESSPSADAKAWYAGLSDAEKQSVAARVCHLQSAQMAHAAREFDSEAGRITTLLKRLAQDATSIVQHGSDAFGADDLTHGSFLEDLETNLKSTGVVIRKCQAARSAVDHGIDLVTETLHRLLQQIASIHDVEANIRLIGLNTTLKCGRLGAEGRALAVVAQELRTNARQIASDVGALTEVLQEIAGAAEAFDRGRRMQSGDRIATLELEMARAAAVFRESGTQLSGALATLAGEGRQVEATLRETADGFTIRNDVRSMLQSARNALAKLGRSNVARPEDTRVVEERMRFFMHEQYTMASERAIHHAVVASAGGHAGASSGVAVSGAGHAPAASAEGDGVGLLDDVLF